MRTTPIDAKFYIQLLANKLESLFNGSVYNDWPLLNLLSNKILQVRHAQLFSQLPTEITITSKIFIRNNVVKIEQIDSIDLIVEELQEIISKLQIQTEVSYCNLHKHLLGINLVLANCEIRGKVSEFINGKKFAELAYERYRHQTNAFLNGDLPIETFHIKWDFVYFKILTE